MTLSGLLNPASPGCLATTQPCWLISSVLIQREEGHLAPLSEAHRAMKTSKSTIKLLASHPGQDFNSEVCYREFFHQHLFSMGKL